MRLAAACLAAALNVGAEEHQHGASHEHQHSVQPSPTPRPAPQQPADEQQEPQDPASRLDRLRQENPDLGRRVDEFLDSVTRDGEQPSPEALELALQIGGSLEAIDELREDLKAGKLSREEFKIQSAEALEGVRGALHGLMETDNSNGRAMRAVHTHFDGPLKAVGFDVSKHAKEMHSTHPGPFTSRYLAKTELDLGKWPKAVEHAKQSLAYEPKNPEALGIMARGKYEQGDYGGAREAATAALSLNPGDQAALAIARLTKDRDAPSGAVGAGAAASAGAPAAPPSGFRTYGDERAVPDFAASAPGAREAAALADRAQTFLRVGDPAAARQAAEKALALEPGQKRASLALSAILMSQGELLKALEVLQAALKASGGKDPDLLTAQAAVLNRLGRYGDALASADLALAADPSKAAAHMSRAWALSGLGRRAEALEALRTAARLDARYQKTFLAASAMSEGEDFLSLFVGEAAAAPAAPKKKRAGRRWVFVFAGAAAGGLAVVALGFSGRKTR
ncbi:MAG: tetratricopeptide repeat protein [Elusimicrobia bacterium]|nr:tetratricopeptide repeat protein [Elusimicrobiota bacterium]